ncbi:MAG: hypothetical protein ACAI25_21050 [Planctomycetota bacterium]
MIGRGLVATPSLPIWVAAFLFLFRSRAKGESLARQTVTVALVAGFAFAVYLGRAMGQGVPVADLLVMTALPVAAAPTVPAIAALGDRWARRGGGGGD